MFNVARLLDSDLEALVQGAGRSLVQVSDGDHGVGAGTIWHSDGLIVTNAHVVSGQETHVILPDGQILHARVLAEDEDRDLAALVVDATGLPTIEVGDSRSLRPGEWVLALGHPLGVLGAAVAGVVIAMGDDLPESPLPGHDLLAVSIRLRPGHSGGPLLDVHGRLVGVNAMMAGPDVGLAVPVHVVKTFLRRSVIGAGVAA